MSQLLTVRDVARLCRLHEMTVRRHISEGKIKAVRVGKGVRVTEEDLQEYIRPQEAARRPRKGTARSRPFNKDDSLLRLAAIVDVDAAAELSESKYASFTEAFA